MAEMNNSVDSVPLLRKDRANSPRVSLNILSDNNDEAERLVRRRQLNTSINTSHSSKTDRRQSMGLSMLAQVPVTKMKEHVSECIKLCVENKINVKNAFSLDIIDFMTYMVKKHDEDMSNLQVASSSLDASAKVYGFRVDGMYIETLKMMGAVEKQKNGDAETMKNVDPTDENVDNQPNKKGLKKKKRSSQHILSSVDALRGKVEVFDPIAIMEDTDFQSSGKLLQVILPNHADSGFHLNLYNDVIVDVTTQTTVDDTNINFSLPEIENFFNTEICPLPNFEFLNYSDTMETKELDEMQTNVHETNFQFDHDTNSLIDDEPAYTDCNDFYNDVEEYAERCNRESAQTQNIVDFREIIKNTEVANTSEYSFMPKNLSLHWAGPSHWKLHNFKQTLNTINTVEVCAQGVIKKKKELELKYNDNNLNQPLQLKFLPKKAIKRYMTAASRNWAEERLTLPRDSHYDIVDAMKQLCLHSLVKLNKKIANNSKTMHFSDISNNVENHDYNNENCVSDYQPDSIDEDYDVHEGDNVIENDFRLTENNEADSLVAFTGSNLVPAPKLTTSIRIPYSLRAKKIDMLQLKGCIWKCLNSSSDKENRDVQETIEEGEANKVREVKRFSEVYKTLPSILTETNAEALSFPIAFVSLLHLANEKSLCIESLPDMSDITVKGD